MYYQSLVCMLVITMCLFSFAVGCSPVEDGSDSPSSEVSPEQVSTAKQEPIVQKSNAYQSSSIEPAFPVPKRAQKTNHQPKKPAVKYVRYAYPNLTDPKLRERYFAEIEKWGWTEQKDEQMGSMHVFTKGEKRIQMTVHQDFFTLFIGDKQA